jgi:hypothetical protein
MSFSFTAQGTKTQTLSSLGSLVHQHDSHSKQTADLVTAMVEAGPSEMETAGVVYDAWYSISAYGHSSAGHDSPTLSVSLSCTYQLRPEPEPEQRGGIEVDPDPADVGIRPEHDFPNGETAGS